MICVPHRICDTFYNLLHVFHHVVKVELNFIRGENIQRGGRKKFKLVITLGLFGNFCTVRQTDIMISTPSQNPNNAYSLVMVPQNISLKFTGKEKG